MVGTYFLSSINLEDDTVITSTFLDTLELTVHEYFMPTHGPASIDVR